MEPVFGFVKHDRVWTIHDFVGDFFTSVSREAMHEERIATCLCHQPLIYLIGTEQVVTAFSVIIAHGNPAVGDHTIGPFDCLIWVISHHNGTTLGTCGFNKVHRRRQFLWRRDPQFKVQPRGRMHPGCQDIVAVAGPGNAFALDATTMFFERHDIGHDLAGMRDLCQTIDDRNGGIFGQFIQGFMIQDTDHHAIHKARQHLCGVRDGFAAAKLHFCAGEHQGFAAELTHTDVEGNSCPGRRLFEDHGQNLASQWAFAAADAIAGGLDFLAGLQNGAQFVAFKFGQVQKIPDNSIGGHSAAPSNNFFSTATAACSRRSTATEISSSVMVRGGRTRTTLSPAGTARRPASRAAAT